MGTQGTVVDDREQGQFVYREGEGGGHLVYRAHGNRLVLVHTEVDPELRGRGIAGMLMMEAVERAVESGETVVPRCPYTRSWLRANPDHAERITIDWDTAPPVSSATA